MRKVPDMCCVHGAGVPYGQAAGFESRARLPERESKSGCLEEVRLCRCRRGEDFSGGGMSGLKFEFPIYQYQSIHDYDYDKYE